MYSTYVNGFSAAMITISKCKAKNTEFVAFLESAHESSSSKLDLQSYLIMPVQRLPRYVLLLTELLKNTPPTHPGYKALTEALKKVKEIADFVNEAKREAENMQQVLSIQDSLSGKRFLPIIEAHRRFDSKGTIIYYSSRKNFKPKSLQYFLFNDLLVLCWPPLTILKGKTQLTKFRVKEMAHLFQCELEDYPDNATLRDVVILKATEDYLLGFNSRKEKEEWFMKYQALRKESMPRKEVDSLTLPPSPQLGINQQKQKSQLSLKTSSSSPAPSPTPSPMASPTSQLAPKTSIAMENPVADNPAKKQKNKQNGKKDKEKEPLLQKDKNKAGQEKADNKKKQEEANKKKQEEASKKKSRKKTCFCF